MILHISNDISCASLKGSAMDRGFVLLEVCMFALQVKGKNERKDQQHLTQKGNIHQDSYLPVEDYIPDQTKSQFVISIYYVSASDIH